MQINVSWCPRMQIIGVYMNSIEKIETYNITVYGSKYTGFVIDSKWNGLVCYKNTNGKVIAVEHESIVDHIFPDLTSQPNTSELSIIMASPWFQDKRGSNENSD